MRLKWKHSSVLGLGKLQTSLTKCFSCFFKVMFSSFHLPLDGWLIAAVRRQTHIIGNSMFRSASRTTLGRCATWLAWLPEVSSNVFRIQREIHFRFCSSTSSRTCRIPFRRWGKERQPRSPTRSRRTEKRLSGETNLGTKMSAVCLFCMPIENIENDCK